MKIPDVIKRDWQVMLVSVALAVLVWLLASRRHG